MKNQFLCPVSGRKKGVKPPSGPSCPFFLLFFFLPFFCLFSCFLFFSFFLIFVHFHFLIFLMYFIFPCSFFLKKKVSSFLFSCISFKYTLLLVLVSEFNCFLRSRCSVEMWCPANMGRESWDWVGPPAWGRACFNSPEWGGGSSPVKTEPHQIVLLVFIVVVEWLHYSKRIIIVDGPDLSDFFSMIFVSEMCVFLFHVQ